jgi:hypothetical protein
MQLLAAQLAEAAHRALPRLARFRRPRRARLAHPLWQPQIIGHLHLKQQAQRPQQAPGLRGSGDQRLHLGIVEQLRDRAAPLQNLPRHRLQNLRQPHLPRRQAEYRRLGRDRRRPFRPRLAGARAHVLPGLPAHRQPVQPQQRPAQPVIQQHQHRRDRPVLARPLRQCAAQAVEAVGVSLGEGGEKIHTQDIH